MRWLSNIPDSELAGKRVLLRLDLNVPFVHDPISGEAEIRDDFRIKNSLPTIKRLQHTGAQIIALAHLGEKGAVIKPAADYLKKLVGGDIEILENLRLDPGEENNSLEFAKELAARGDFYINEAFSASHRAHASIVGLPTLLPSAAGLEFEEEVQNLSALLQPESSLLVIIAGAKFGTKLPLVRRFLDIADRVFIAGALAHPLFRLKGYEIGRSLCDDSAGDLSDLVNHPKIILPSEVMVREGEKIVITTPDQVSADGIIVDAGPRALADLENLIKNSRTILWNGPLGNYEQGYGEPTRELAKLIAESGTKSVLGGGDTIAAIESLDLFDQFSFVSTAGGAMLDYLASGTLPGIEALEESERKFGK